MLTNNITQGQYDFHAEPKVMKPRTKYREAPVIEEELTASNANIMFDKRVVRGNTYAIVGTTSREAVQPLKNTTNRPRPKHLSPKHLEASQMEAIHADVSTPRPVEGRKHAEVQTDENIEYLTDRPPEFEKDAQTDFYIDRPVNRLFVPQKIGEDKDTQIWEGELFDFDYEVEPILQTLIGKTLEQGRMEVLEEEEHKIMKEEQKRYDELRYAELTEAQKMEAEERRKLDESERRRKQHRLKNEQAVTSHKKYISRLMAKTCLENVNRNSFNILNEQGNFQNAFEFELHRGLLPWLYEDIVGQQTHGFTITDTINALNAIISQNVAKAHEEAIQREIDRKQRVVEDKQKQEEEKVERRKKRAEARAKRKEEERLRVLKEKILVTLIAKGEQKAGILSQVFSDIDALGRTGHIVGLLGGLIGEILIVLSTLESFKQVDEENPLAVLQTIAITQEAVQKLVKHVVEDIIKEGKVEVGVNGELEAQLTALDPELNLENLHTKPALATEIRAALVSALSSVGLDIIVKNAGSLELQEGYVELIANAIADEVLNPDESARKLKLVRSQVEYLQENRLESYAQFMPPVEGLPMFNLAEAKGVRTKKKKEKEVVEQSGPIEGTVPEEVIEPAVTPAEVEFEDLVSIFPVESPEDRVLVHQKPAAIVLRRLMLVYLSTLFREMDMKEIEVLKKVNNKADEVEKVLVEQFPVKINLFVFDRS